MRWAPSAIMGLLLIGCGHAPPVVETPAQLSAVRPTSAGPRVAALARPTPQVVWLAMWIDAGARDAKVPQVATLAADLAARAANDSVPLALPDGIAIAKLCWRDELTGCLKDLRRGLSLRAPSHIAVRRARLRLLQARRRALARQPSRLVRGAALEALLGSARGFLPLGRGADDHRATAGAVASFLRSHFGVRRTLIVGAGDIDGAALADAVQRVFASGPRAKATFVPRSLPAPTEGSSDVAVVVGDRGRLSVAAALPRGARGRYEARRLHAALADASAVTSQQLVLETLPVRGGLLAFVDGPAGDMGQLARRVALYEQEPQRSRANPGRFRDRHPWEGGGSLRDTATRLGARWCARGRHRPPERLAIGIQVRGGRADETDSDDPDQRLRAETHVRVAQALTKARAPVSWSDLTRNRGHISGRLDNGVQIEVHRRTTSAAAIAIRFGMGAASDPSNAHGRAALLAEVAARHCDGMDADALAVTLRRMGANLSARVEAGSWGLLLEMPRHQVRAGIDLLLQCALTPTLDRQYVTDTRAAMRGRFLAEEPQSALWAGAGQLLSPGAPGWVAPAGGRASLPGIDTRALAALRAASVRGQTTAIAIVADLDLDELASLAARRLRHLKAGSPRSAERVRPAATAPDPERRPFHRAVVGWRANAGPGGAAGARALAELARAMLANLPGARVVWSGGDADAHGSWAALGLQVLPEHSLTVLPRLQSRLGRIEPTALMPLVRSMWSTIARGEAARSASIGVHADRLARQAVTPMSGHDEEASLRTARALLRTRARVKVWR